MGEWRECMLEKVAEVQTGPFGSQLKNEQYITGGTPVVTVEHINNFRIIDFDYPSVTDEDKNRLSKYLLKAGDIIFTRVGSVDLSAFVKPHQDGWMFSSRMLRVRPNQEVDSRFLSYFFQQKRFREYILNISVGAIMPSINTEILKGIPVSYPSIPEQKAISSVLSSLDDKIDLLHRQNKTLEAMAETLFRQWFVEKAQEDWEKITIGNCCRLITKGTTPTTLKKAFVPSGINFIKVNCIDENGNFIIDKVEFIDEETNELLHRSKLEEGDILYSIAGTIGRLITVGKEILPANVNQALAILRVDSKKISPTYIKYCLKDREITENLQSKVVHAVQPNLSLGEISKTTVPFPPNKMLNNFVDKVTPIESKLRKNKIQIGTLEKLRETLLPKMMSGAVHVSYNYD